MYIDAHIYTLMNFHVHGNARKYLQQGMHLAMLS